MSTSTKFAKRVDRIRLKHDKKYKKAIKRDRKILKAAKALERESRLDVVTVPLEDGYEPKHKKSKKERKEDRKAAKKAKRKAREAALNAARLGFEADKAVEKAYRKSDRAIEATNKAMKLIQKSQRVKTGKGTRQVIVTAMDDFQLDAEYLEEHATEETQQAYWMAARVSDLTADYLQATEDQDIQQASYLLGRVKAAEALLDGLELPKAWAMVNKEVTAAEELQIKAVKAGWDLEVAEFFAENLAAV